MTPGKELYHCFSCGEGGDVIKFIMKMESLQFGEAVERLAARAGIELRYEAGGYVPGQETGQRRRLIEAHRMAQEFYAERMHADSGRPAQAFLAERGFTLADADQFGMGYSPAAWDELTKHLRGRGFTEDELLKAGLARRTSRGGLIDMFRGRLMWPIRDLTGETIAFGARKLNPEDDPKYLNTPETQIFKKSQVLYGADLAKREIAKRRQAVIVEGYTDVMACHLSGVPTAVATCGTSFGEEHVKVLRRLIMDTDASSGEVIFTFDGDAAGQKAALRAFSLEEKFVTQTFVAVQPDGPRPVRPAAQARRGRRPRPGGAAGAAVRVRDQVGARQARPGHARRAVRRDRRGRADHRPDQGPGRSGSSTPSTSTGGSGSSTSGTSWTGSGRPPGQPGAEPGAPPPVRRRPRHRRRAASGARTRHQGRAARRLRSGRTTAHDPVLRVEREALKLAVQWPALTGPEFDTLGAAAFSVPAHAAVFGLIDDLRRGGHRGAGAGLGGGAARGGAGRPGARVRDRAGGGAAPGGGRAGREVRGRDPRPGRGAGRRAGRSPRSRRRLQRMNPEEDQAAYGRMFGELVALEQRRKVLLDRATGGYMCPGADGPAILDGRARHCR